VVLRYVKRFIALVAIAAAAVLVAPPGPASASDGCIPLFAQTGEIVGYVCPPVLVSSASKPTPCFCPYWAFSIREELVLPVEQQRQFLISYSQGFDLVGSALATGDPALRARAQQDFASAVQVLGKNTLKVGEVGVMDPRTKTFGAQPEPWLQAAAADIVNGLTLTQQALATGGKLDTAWAAFVHAYKEIAAHPGVKG